MPLIGGDVQPVIFMSLLSAGHRSARLRGGVAGELWFWGRGVMSGGGQGLRRGGGGVGVR